MSEGLDLAQRLLEVMGGDSRELLEFRIGARQLMSPFGQFPLGTFSLPEVLVETHGPGLTILFVIKDRRRYQHRDKGIVLGF